MFYKFVAWLCRCYYRLFYGLKIVGQQHIPKEGAIVVCGNHKSLHDPVMLLASCPRVLHFVAKDSLFKYGIVRFVLKRLGVIPVARGNADMTMVRTAISLLKQGEGVGIFPEGTRVKDKLLGKGHAGAAMIALRSDAQMIPCAINSQYKLFRRTVIEFGMPISANTFKEEKNKNDVVIAKVMGEIEQLLIKNR